MDWLGFALGGSSPGLGWIRYGSGWRGSERERQPQLCWETLGFQGLGTLLIVLHFIQQGNWLFSLGREVHLFFLFFFSFSLFLAGEARNLPARRMAAKLADALAISGISVSLPRGVSG